MNSKTKLSRRQFLKVLAFSGAAAGLGVVLGQRGLNFAELLAGNLPEVVRETHLLMGTVVNLTLVGDNPAQARAAARATLAEMRRQVGIFNRFDPASQLSQLNARGVLRSPDPALVEVLQQAQTISKASAGAFDVSVKPLLDLYQAAQARAGQLPSPAEIRMALGRVDASKLVCDWREIGFALDGMSLTLDGIAKGAVIDAGVSMLRGHGFQNVIVEAGGDLLASGEHGISTPWKIGLRSPRQGGQASLTNLSIRNMAVATSGDYLLAFTSDFSANHILDPRLGTSAQELASATVVAPTAVLADALATALIVCGSRDGLSLLERFPGCEAYLIDKELRSVSSPGMAAYLV